MPQVVSQLTPEEHAALTERAKLNRRSIGNQLIAEAFQSAGRDVPEYLNAPKGAKGKQPKASK